jgi:hypothetical protein
MKDLLGSWLRIRRPRCLDRRVIVRWRNLQPSVACGGRACATARLKATHHTMKPDPVLLKLKPNGYAES